MSTQSPTDTAPARIDSIRGLIATAVPPAKRKITLTETCDLATVEAYSEPIPRRRFALLVFCDSEAQVRLLDEGGTTVVGREPPCEIVVHDSSISRQHARFSLSGDGVW